MTVRPKKKWGQHFLTDDAIAGRIADSLLFHTGYSNLLEIGGGTGMLTKFLFGNKNATVLVADIDPESVGFLKCRFPDFESQIIEADFLEMNVAAIFEGSFGVIGNFPYNISSQIFFRVLENRDKIPEVVGMLQKETAERLASPPGKKAYGILSVFLQLFYDIEYLFTVHEDVFDPPPKVKSGVVRLLRNQRKELDCSEKLLFRIVKQSFGTRRKMLRNSLKSFQLPDQILENSVFDKRPEQLSPEEFIELTLLIETSLKE